MEIFGAGGGAAVSAQLTRNLGYDVPPARPGPHPEQDLRIGGDSGIPFAIAEGHSPAQEAIRKVGTRSHRARGLAGRLSACVPLINQRRSPRGLTM